MEFGFFLKKFCQEIENELKKKTIFYQQFGIIEMQSLKFQLKFSFEIEFYEIRSFMSNYENNNTYIVYCLIEMNVSII